MIHLPLCLFSTGSTEGAILTGPPSSLNDQIMITLYRFETILYGPLGVDFAKS